MKIGNLLVNAAYLGSKVLTAIAVGATKVWEGVSKYIKFADPVVEQLCMKWSSDGIGLTPEDAAKVTDIGTTFRGNTEITSFDELKAFGVASIKDNAFRECVNLTTVNLAGVRSVMSRGFCDCTSLENLGDTSRIESIDGPNTFQNTPALKEVDLPALRVLSSLGHFISSGISKVISLGSVTTIPTTMFNGCASLSEVNLPNSITTIGDAAFANNSSLSKINLGECTSLSAIGGNAFKRVISPTIEIPPSVTVIGDEAFRFTQTTTFVVLSDTPPQIGSLTFNGTPSTMSIYVPYGSLDAYKGATNWSAYADRIKPLSEYVEPTTE
jgi:hypothetical protein